MISEARLHFDFGELTADFEGGEAAVARLVDHRYYQNANFVFITPDNCLDRLRLQGVAG